MFQMVFSRVLLSFFFWGSSGVHTIAQFSIDSLENFVGDYGVMYSERAARLIKERKQGCFDGHGQNVDNATATLMI